MPLLIYEIRTSIALTVFFEQRLYVFGIGTHLLLVSIIAINKHHKMRGVWHHLGALIVAGWRSNASQTVSVYRQSLDIDVSSSYSLVRFTGLANAQC